MSGGKSNGGSNPDRLRKILEPSIEEKEFREKLYPDVAEVENAKILCSVCQKDVKHVFLLKKKSYKHIFLQVAVCKGCLKFYDDGDFSLDEDGDDKYCRWCGQGGTLCLCSNCPSSFCKKCIRTNLERKYQLLVDKDDWKCFFCDPKPLYKMRALSWAVDQHLSNIKKKELAQKIKSQEKKPPSAQKARAVIVRCERPEYPAFDINQIDISAHIETAKFWMNDLCGRLKPSLYTRIERWTQCDETVRNAQTPEDFIAAKSALENLFDDEIDLLVRNRQQFIEGVDAFKKKSMESSTCEVAPKENGVEGNHLTDDVEPVVVENPKARARRKALKVVSDDEDGATTNGDSLNNTTVDMPNSTSAANDSLADMFDESTVAEVNDMNGTIDDSDRSGEQKKEDRGTDADVKKENHEPPPRIRLRNLSDLMDPKLSVKSTPEKQSKPLSSIESKSKPSQKNSVEMITLSSDEDSSDVAVKSKITSLKIAQTKSLAKPDKSNALKKSQKEGPKKDFLDSDDDVLTNKIVRSGVVTSKASDSDEPTQAKLFSSSESESEGADKAKENVDASGKCKTDVEKTGDDYGQSSKKKGGKKETTVQEKVPGRSDNNVNSSSMKMDKDTSKDTQAILFSSSESGGEGAGKPKKNVNASGERKTDVAKTADDYDQSSNEEQGEKEISVQEKVQERSEKNGSRSSKKKGAQTSKDKKEDDEVNNSNSDDSSDSTSSSDPLSHSSSDDDKKKTPPKKLNRSYFSENDKETEKSPKKKKKKCTVFSSNSDSDFDGKNLLKKRIASSTPAKKRLKNEPKEVQKSKSSKTVVSDSGGDSMDMDVEKLCDLKSLQPKRGHSSSPSSDSSNEDNAKEQKKASKKTKQDVDKLSDFYDSEDDQDRKKDDVQEDVSDLESTLRREFPQYNDGAVIEEDIRTSILNMSSSSEPELDRVSDEEGDSSEKKSKSESSKSRKETDKRKESRKGKKKYVDKLMEMNIDSDSDDMAKGEKKYEKLKAKRAEKSEKESDEEDAIVKKKKAVAKRKGKPRKKMFSDSDESPNEDGSDGNKSDSEKSEDDDDDDVGKKKRKKKKRSSSGSDSSEDKPKTPTKKRRRIKTGSDSTDSGSDGSGKNDKTLNDSATKGRKSIRRILKEDDLKQTTQAALKSEQERKKRIAEKQKLYNAMVEKASEQHKELEELVLDFNPKTKEKLVVVDPTLVKKLKPHQGEGIKFMWDSCFETLKMAKSKSGSGCILAHCMGLGKSLQVVTLVHTLLNHPEIGVKTVLIVAPVSTVLNWANEFDKWLKDVGSGQDVNVFHMTRCQTNHRAFLLNDWSRQGGVLIMGYNLLRTLSNPKSRVRAAVKKVFQEKLVDPGPDVVVCDEGHILKNEKTAISITMSKMKTRRRIVLTGTPLQNNLVEYHCMVQFVKPSLLGTKKEFTNRFVNPIQNGQFEDSTPHDVKIMKRRAHVLHTMLDGLVQRKDYNVLTPYLPPKFEYVIHLKLSDVQVKLYRYYLLNIVHGGDSESDGTAPKGKRLFVDFQNLMWICLHPRTLLMKSVKDEKKAEMEFSDTDEEGSLKEFVVDGSSSSSEFKTSSSDSDSDKSGSEKEKPKTVRRKTRGQGAASEPEDEPPAPSKQWWSELIDDEQMDDIRQSSKLFLFFTILKYCEEIGDKLLIFSQSLYTLDLLEYFLDKIDEETQKPEEDRIPGIKGFEGSWAKGLDYFRLDGSSACENRESWCKSFNRKDNVRARLFLISTRAGGLGINLTGANRVIIFDASWNPSFDVQSLFRVYRFGQDKPCYIYRFLSKGTMEEKIYERQVAKLSTALRVIDEQQIDRHFSHSALAELYMFDPEGSELQGTPALPKDRLMAELLQNHSDIILSHHQHDSLLENQEDQELSEEERKAAWTEFESEKNQKPPVFQNTNMMNTLVSMMMEIRTKLKIQNPAWTEEQLRMGALQILQQYPDFKAMTPYLNMIFQQQQMQQQQQQMQQQMMQGQQRPGMPAMSNHQFPGMAFPSFQYPLYNNQPQMNNSLAQLNNVNAGRLNNVGQVNNVAQVQNALLEQLLKQNAATNLNSLLVNPKHAPSQEMTPKIQTVRSLQKVQPPSDAAKSKSTAAGTSTEPVVLDDSDPIILTDD